MTKRNAVDVAVEAMRERGIGGQPTWCFLCETHEPCDCHRESSHKTSKVHDPDQPLPCPFCGVEPTVWKLPFGLWCVDCRGCKFTKGDCRARSEAIQAWNTRKG